MTEYAIKTAIAPPMLKSCDQRAVLAFIELYTFYLNSLGIDSVSSSSLKPKQEESEPTTTWKYMPLRNCLSRDIRDGIELESADALATDASLFKYLEELTSFKSAGEIIDAFKNVVMDIAIPDANMRISKYNSTFLAAKRRLGAFSDSVKEKHLVKYYAQGIRPLFLSKIVLEELTFKSLKLSEVIKFSREQIELQQRHFQHKKQTQERTPSTTQPKTNTTTTPKKQPQRQFNTWKPQSPATLSTTPMSPVTPARKRYCYICNDPTHIADACPQRVSGLKAAPQKTNMLTAPSPTPNGLLKVLVQIEEVEATAIIDPGSSRTTMTMDIAKKVGSKIFLNQETIETATQEVSKTLGNTTATLRLPVEGPGERVSVSVNFMILSGENQILVGSDILRSLGFMDDHSIHINFKKNENLIDSNDTDLEERFELPQICLLSDEESGKRGREELTNITINLDNEEQVLTMENIFSHYPELFDTEFPKEGIKAPAMPIEFYDESVIIKRKPRPLPPVKRQIALSIFEELCQKGLARPSNGPHSSPIVLVTYDNKKPRLTGDYSGIGGVNDATKPFPSPVPSLSEIWMKLSKAKYIATLDLPRAFWQLMIEEKDIPKTALVCPGGYIEMLRASMGLKNVPSFCQKILSSIFCNECVNIHIDDIIISSESWKDFVEQMKRILQKAREYRVRLSAKKTNIVSSNYPIKIVGSILHNHQRLIAPERVEALQKLKPVSTLKGARSLVGCFNFIREFIPNYSTIAAPLLELVRKDKPVVWTEECTAALEMLKLHIVEGAVLALPDDTKQVLVTTDASDEAVGGIVWIEVSNSEKGTPFVQRTVKPVGFYAHTLSTAQRKWSTLQKELYAIVKTLTQPGLENFLKSVNFELFTDHRNLTYLHSVSTSNLMVKRWGPLLDEFQFSIFHVPGKDNVWADFLSRNTFIASMINVEDVIQDATVLKDKQREAIENGLLDQSHLIKSEGIWKTKKGKIIIPPSMVNTILGRLHDNALAAHCSAESILHKLRKADITWPKMEKEVRNYVNKCISCSKSSSIHKQVVLGTGCLFSYKPFESFHMDTMGPFNEDTYGKKYIFVVIDAFSRYCELIPTNSNDAREASKALMKCVMRYGVPNNIRTDAGSEYVNSAIEYLCSTLKISQIKTIPYHHESNGMVERKNQDVLRTLRKLVIDLDAYNTWSDLVPSVQFALNSMVSRVTKYTPHQILFGSEPSYSIFENMKQTPNKQELPLSVKDYLTSLVEKMKKLWKEVRNHQQQSIESDGAKENDEFKENDLVLVAPGTRQDKLKSQCKGPYRISRLLGNNSLEITDLLNGSKYIRSTYQMKKYPGTDLEEAKRTAASDHQEYVLEKILDHKKENDELTFLLRWAGYGPEDDTWEKFSDVDGNIMLRDYMKLHSLRRPNRKKKRSNVSNSIATH